MDSVYNKLICFLNFIQMTQYDTTIHRSKKIYLYLKLHIFHIVLIIKYCTNFKLFKRRSNILKNRKQIKLMMKTLKIESRFTENMVFVVYTTK